MVARGSSSWKTLLKASRLAGWRLSRSLAWKFARFFAVLVSVGFTLAVVILAVNGRTQGVHAVVGRTCVVLAWLTSPWVAWWTASDRAQVDRKEGVEDLARLHGIDATSLRWGRGIAATVRLALLVLACATPVVVATLACAPTPGAALRSLVAFVPLAGFSIGVGLVGGGLATACGVLAPSRGRTLFLATVVAPWLLDGVVTGARAGVSSIPGLLGLLADLSAGMGVWS